MHTQLCLILLCVLALCPVGRAANTVSAPSKPRPFVGMTRAQALKLYGEPFQRGTVKEGERWVYQLKFGEVYGRARVPFADSSRNIFLGLITFDARGRVRTYDWTHTVAHSSIFSGE